MNPLIVMKHSRKSNLHMRGLFSFHFQIVVDHFRHSGNWGRNHGGMVIVGSLSDLPIGSHSARSHPEGIGPLHNGLSLSSYIHHQSRKFPKDKGIVQLNPENLSTRDSLRWLLALSGCHSMFLLLIIDPCGVTFCCGWKVPVYLTEAPSSVSKCSLQFLTGLRNRNLTTSFLLLHDIHFILSISKL